MTLPTIHLNGTDATDLLGATLDAYRAISSARDVLRRTAPHGRDYYPQGEHAIHQAGEEYRARVAALETVMAELDAIAAHLVEVR